MMLCASTLSNKSLIEVFNRRSNKVLVSYIILLQQKLSLCSNKHESENIHRVPKKVVHQTHSDNFVNS